MPAGPSSLLPALFLALGTALAAGPAAAQSEPEPASPPPAEAPATGFELWWGRAQQAQARAGCVGALPLDLAALASPDAARSPRLAEARLALGSCYVQERLWTLARQTLEPLFALGPSSPLHRPAGALLVETALARGGRPAAEPLAAEIERIHGSGALPPSLLILLGEAALKDRAFDRARSLLLRVPVEAPEYARAQYDLGGVLIASGDLRGAADALDRAAAVAQDPDVRGDARLALGRVAFDLGRYPEALTSFAAVRGEPRWAEEAQLEYAWSLIEMGRVAEARGALDDLLRTLPRSTVLPDAQVLGAYLRLESGEVQPAWDRFKDLLGEYQVIDDHMGRELDRYPDPRAFAEHAVAEAALPAQIGGPLPHQVFGWALDRPIVHDADATLARARRTAEEVREAQGMLADTMERARQFAAHMTDDIEDAIVHVQERLNAARARLILTRMSFRERNLYERIETMKRELQVLERRLSSFSEEVGVRRSPGPEGGGMKAEAAREIASNLLDESTRVRRALDVSLLSEDDLLDVVFRHLGLDRDPVGQRLSGLFAQTRELKAMLGKLAGDFNGMVAMRSVEERQGLAALGAAAAGLVARVEGTRGESIRTAFREVEGGVLVNALAQAQLGFVDASWKVKETETSRIDALYQKEGSEMAQATDAERAWRTAVERIPREAEQAAPAVERASFEGQAIADLTVQARRLEMESARLGELVRALGEAKR